MRQAWLREVAAQSREECLLADVGHQLLQDAGPLEVGDVVEARGCLLDVADLLADRVRRGRPVGAVAGDLRPGQEAGPLVGELGRGGGRPVGGPLGERLVEPQVVPPAHRHHVAEPHVRHLVQQDRRALLALPVGGFAAVQQDVAPRHAAVVLHRAAHVRHEDLVVAALRKRHREPLAEECQSGCRDLEQLVGIAVEARGERLAAVQPQVVPVPLEPTSVERSGVDNRHVRRQRWGVGEHPTPAVGHLLDVGRTGVGQHGPGVGGRHGERVHRLEVGLVEAGPGAPRVVRLERRPDIDQLVGGIDRAVHAGALAGLALHRLDDQHVLGGQTRQGDPRICDRGRGQLDVVQGRSQDLGGAVDEGGRTRRTAGERRAGHRPEPGSLGQVRQVDLDVVAVDGEQPGTFAGLVTGQAPQGVHVDPLRGSGARECSEPGPRCCHCVTSGTPLARL